MRQEEASRQQCGHDLCNALHKPPNHTTHASACPAALQARGHLDLREMMVAVTLLSAAPCGWEEERPCG